MKSIRKAMLAIAAGAALAATLATTLSACAQDSRHQEPTAVPASPPAAFNLPSPNLPPAYFGPAYSAAAVYQTISR